MTHYYTAFCPICGMSHGTRALRDPKRRYIRIKRTNFWKEVQNFEENKPFGVIQESLGRGKWNFIGYFSPEEDVQGFFPLIKARLLTVIREWLNRGWLDSGDVMATIGRPRPAPPAAAKEIPTPVAQEIKAPKAPAAPREKAPWQITQRKFVSEDLKKRRQEAKEAGFELNVGLQRRLSAEQHEKTIRAAISIGKPVPEEVLKDYPDLVTQGVKQAETVYMIQFLGVRGEGGAPTPAGIYHDLKSITEVNNIIKEVLEKSAKAGQVSADKITGFRVFKIVGDAETKIAEVGSSTGDWTATIDDTRPEQYLLKKPRQ